MSDSITEFEVTETPTGSWRIAWPATFAAGEVRIQPLAGPDGEAAGPPLEAGSPAQGEGLVPGRRHYFRIDAAGAEPLVVAQRDVPLERGVNFRDIGGYAGADGRRVRWGRLFRSGHLADLTAADRERVAALGITTVCDFRLAEEAANEHGELPGAPERHVLNIAPGVKDPRMLHDLFDRTDDPREVTAAICALMASMVEFSGPNYAALFQRLLAHGEGAVLMNCSAGKERTGLGTVLLLTALGVPEETAMFDFMLSARYFPAAAEVERVLRKYEVRARGGQERALVAPLLETERAYIDAAIGAMTRRSGSIAGFVREVCGVGVEESRYLRDKYLV